MKKLKLPRHIRNGIKIWCKKCRQNNTGCNHYEYWCYRANFIDPITGHHRSKMLVADNYDDAVIESLEFKKNKDVQKVNSEISGEGNDYTLAESILKYDTYLSGNSQYQHLHKKVSNKHKNEVIGYCKMFNESIKTNRHVKWIRPNEINRNDVSYYYGLLVEKYKAVTINKAIQSLKTFIDFLINTEDIIMKNYFKECIRLHVPKKNIDILSKEEFDAILTAVDNYTPLKQTTKAGRKDNMYYPWLKNAFKIFLFVGGRREEVLNLKWSDMYISEQGVKFFYIRNLKVERIQKKQVDVPLLAPVTADFEKLLIEMGMNEKMGLDEKLIDPKNEFTISTLMEKLTDAFTHYRIGAGIEKEVTLKHLRKTYLTWTNHIMGNETSKISTAGGSKVLRDHYLAPDVLTALELAALKVKIFG
ncbi:MAG: hypothetical protein J0I09_14380 [Sphingobacteriia bacterium]|nr:hypothetical protein [Sphingobacteriia bacterium]